MLYFLCKLDLNQEKVGGKLKFSYFSLRNMREKLAKKTQAVEALQFMKQILERIAPVNPVDLQKLLNKFEVVQVPKNEIIINEGEIADSFYCIYKGIVRIYYYKDGKAVIERFEKESGFFGGNFTHLTKKPGIHVYETLESSILLRMKFADLEELCAISHDIEHLYRITIGLFHNNFVDRIYTFKALSTEKRYHEFIRQYGDIINRISMRNVANYLGMSSETLSRIRAKYDKFPDDHQTQK